MKLAGDEGEVDNICSSLLPLAPLMQLHTHGSSRRGVNCDITLVGTYLESKAKQSKRSLDESAGRSLHALQIT